MDGWVDVEIIEWLNLGMEGWMGTPPQGGCLSSAVTTEHRALKTQNKYT